MNAAGGQAMCVTLHVCLLALALGCAKPTSKDGGGKRLGGGVLPAGARVIGFDPSVTGLAGVVGEVVFNPGSNAAYAKFGPNPTDWQTFPGSGGGVTLADRQMYFSNSGTGTGDPGLRFFANGSLGINFPSNFTDLSFPGIPGDTAGLNVWGVATASWPAVRNTVAGWRDNAAGKAVATYIDHGSLNSNVDGAEYSQYTQELASNGSYIDAFVVSSVTGVPGAAQVRMPDGTQGHPGMSFLTDTTQGFYEYTGSGPDYNIGLSVHGSLAYDFFETGTVGNVSHYIRAKESGTGQGGFLVSPGNTTGLLYDPNSGGAYVAAQASSFAIGPPGALSTSANQGFIAMPTTAGTPTGTPANMVSGKAACVVDTTNLKICCYLSSAWKCTAALI